MAGRRHRSGTGGDDGDVVRQILAGLKLGEVAAHPLDPLFAGEMALSANAVSAASGQPPRVDDDSVRLPQSNRLKMAGSRAVAALARDTSLGERLFRVTIQGIGNVPHSTGMAVQTLRLNRSRELDEWIALKAWGNSPVLFLCKPRHG